MTGIITQNTLTGGATARKKIAELRPLPNDTPPEFHFQDRASKKQEKRERA